MTSKYIVKRRWKVEWTTQTIRGPRRVRRWGPWEAVEAFAVRADADARARREGGVPGYLDVGVFYRGKRVD